MTTPATITTEEPKSMLGIPDLDDKESPGKIEAFYTLDYLCHQQLPTAFCDWVDDQWAIESEGKEYWSDASYICACLKIMALGDFK